jgi:hypothetical protein
VKASLVGWKPGVNAAGFLTVATVLVIGAENDCLNFATGNESEVGFDRAADVAGTKLVRGFYNRHVSLYLQVRRG